MAVGLCLGTVADVFAECCFKYEVKKAAILSPVLALFKLSRCLLAIDEVAWQSQTILQVLIPPQVLRMLECVRKVFVSLQLGLKINPPQDIF